MESVANATAGAAASIISMLVLYPLDNVRTRLQVHAKRLAQASPVKQTRADAATYTDSFQDEEYDGMLACMKAVARRDGWQALYNGLGSALIGITISSGVYFFWYDAFKRLALERTGRFQHFKKQSITPMENLGVATAAGVVNVFITLPIWVLNAQMKLSSRLSLTDRVKTLYKQGGIQAFYRGLIPSLILVSNPAIQFMSYEQLSRLYFLIRRSRLRRAGLPDSSVISPFEQFALAAIAKALATILTYPYQVVKERLLIKSKAYSYTGTWDAAIKMYKNEGPSAFFRGLKTKMSQTVINAAFLFVVYEQMLMLSRKLLRMKVQ